MTKHLEALKAAKSSMDFWGNSNPKCPHCGTEFNIQNNEAWSLYNDNGLHRVDCPTCEREFSVETRCSYTFSTDEQDEVDEDDDPASAVSSTEGR
jgi:transposase-like protein